MITYPRNTEARYVLFRISTGELINPNTTYPRTDGMELVGADPDLVYLEIKKQVEPDYDSRYFILVDTQTPDVENGNWLVTYATQKRELAAIEQAAENVETQAVEEWLPYNRQTKLLILGLAVLFRQTENQTLLPKEVLIKDKIVALGLKLWRNDATLQAKLAAIVAGQEPDLDADYERPIN